MFNLVLDVFRGANNAFQYRRDELKFDTIVFSLRIRNVELKQEKKELGRINKRDFG